MFHLYAFRDDIVNKYLDAFIVKDNIKLAISHVNAGYPNGDSSATLVVELEPLDRVYRQLATGTIFGVVRLGRVGSVSFSGFLTAEIP